MKSSARCVVPVLLVSLLAVSDASAAVYSGIIKEFDAQKRTLTVSIPSRSFSKALSISSSVSITIDGKPAKLEDVKAGDSGTVSTSGTQVTRISVKTSASPAKPKPAPKPKPMNEPEPEPEPSESLKTVTTEAIWPQFRGPARDGNSTEKDLNWTWPPKPLWSQKGLGEGYASVSVGAEGKVFTMGTQGNTACVFAMNLSDGQALWGTAIGNKRDDGMGGGPRSTPSIDGEVIYALSSNGDLACLTAGEGGVIWNKNILREFGGKNITWGISESVLVDGEKLICTPGGQRGTMVALNKRTGQTLWTCQAPGNPQAGYSSAIVVDIDGVRQYVNMVHDRIFGVHAETGEYLWDDRRAVNDTANCSAPVHYLENIFYATGYNTGGSLVNLKNSGNKIIAEHKYHTRDMQNHHGGMVLVDGYLYGSSDPGVFTCLNPHTGEVQWRDRGPGKGSVTYVDGHLIVRNEDGPVTLLKANPKEYQEVGQFQPPQEFRSERKQWAYPVVADKKLFLRDQDVLLVYDLSE